MWVAIMTSLYSLVMSARHESLAESTGVSTRNRKRKVSRLSSTTLLLANLLNPVGGANIGSAEILGATAAPQIVLVSFTSDAGGHHYAPDPFRAPDPLAGILEEPVTGIPKERQDGRRGK